MTGRRLASALWAIHSMLFCFLVIFSRFSPVSVAFIRLRQCHSEIGLRSIDAMQTKRLAALRSRSGVAPTGDVWIEKLLRRPETRFIPE